MESVKRAFPCTSTGTVPPWLRLVDRRCSQWRVRLFTVWQTRSIEPPARLLAVVAERDRDEDGGTIRRAAHFCFAHGLPVVQLRERLLQHAATRCWSTSCLSGFDSALQIVVASSGLLPEKMGSRISAFTCARTASTASTLADGGEIERHDFRDPRVDRLDEPGVLFAPDLHQFLASLGTLRIRDPAPLLQRFRTEPPAENGTDFAGHVVPGRPSAACKVAPASRPLTRTAKACTHLCCSLRAEHTRALNPAAFVPVPPRHPRGAAPRCARASPAAARTATRGIPRASSGIHRRPAASGPARP